MSSPTSSSPAYLELAPDGAVRLANTSAQQLLGIREEDSGFSFFDLLPVDSPLRGDMAEMGRGERDGAHLQERLATPEGGQKWMNIIVAEVPDTERISVMLTELTSQERGEALEHYEEMFRKNTAPKLLIDPETGYIADANPAALTFYGYGIEEIRQQRIQDINQLSEEAVQAEWEKARREERRYFEFRHRLASGEIRDVKVYSGPITIGEREYLHSIIHDVTEVHRYLEHLEQYKATFEALPVGIYRSDLGSEGHFSYVNPAMARIFGARSTEELLGHPTANLYRDPAQKRQFSEDLAEAGHVNRRELALQTLDGRLIWGAITAQVRETEDGETVVDGIVEDITQQHQMEEALQRLVAILDNTPDYVALHDANGTVRYLNAAAHYYLGLPTPSSREQWRTMVNGGETQMPVDMSDVEGTLRWVHPGWAADKVRNEGLPTAYDTGSWQGETAIRRSDGEPIPMSQVILVHRDDAGNVSQISTIMRDITQRRSLEDQLRGEKVLTESILASLPGIFYMLDAQGRLVRWNEQLEAVTGHTPEELQGADARTFVPKQEQDRITEDIAETFSEGRTLVESKLQTVVGSTPYLFNGFRVELNGSPSILGVALDLSEQKGYEKRLQHERNYSRAIIQALPSIFYMLDNQGFLVHWNQHFEELLGLDAEAMAQTTAPSLFPESEQTLIQNRIEAVFQDGETVIEGHLIDANGMPRPHHLTGQRLMLDGHPYLLGVGQDISERKEAEANLRRRAEGEALVQTISTELLAATYDRIDATIEDALARIGQSTEADRSYLFQITDDGQTMSNTHEWTTEGVSPRIQDLQGLLTADFAWLLDQLRQRSILPIQSLADVPDSEIRAHLTRQGIHSLLLIPMAREEGVIGFLGLDAVDRERVWSESEQHLLRIAADTLASALARQRLESQLRYQARHDPLTGLVNRRPFEETLVQETHRAQRYGQTFALIMMDIDHFKAINDTYGHELGDRVLTELTTVVSDRLREADLLARWGGEEFMALLPETDERGARQVAEAIRHQVADQDFPGVGHLTVSLGVAEYRAYEEIKDVTKRVDDALYAAKEAGRNRVAVDGEEPVL